MKNTDSAENKGYDAGKKVSGIKRHIAVDTQGLPHAIHVTTANVTDRAGALAMFDHHQADLGEVEKVLVDGGYTKCRRLWKNCERKLNTSLQMVVLAFAALLLKRL